MDDTESNRLLEIEQGFPAQSTRLCIARGSRKTKQEGTVMMWRTESNPMKSKLDLQMFADVMNSTLSDGMSAEIKNYYEKRLIDQAEPNLVHDQFGDCYPIPKNGGKTIEFRKYDSLDKATTPLVEGVTPTGKALNVSSITSDLHQYGDWVPMTDMLTLTAIDNNILQATRILASQAGRTMDTITRDVLAGGTSVIYAPKVAADGTTTEVTSRKELDSTCRLTPDVFFRAAAQLGAMNADKFGDSYVAIIHPYASYDLMRNPEWIDVHKYRDPDTIFNGEIGKLGGIRFVESSEAIIWKNDTCPDGLAVFGTIVLGAHAYGVTELEGGGLEHIVKQLGYGDDPLNQRASVGWKGIKTAERLVEQYMVRIESTSQYSSMANAN
jgi:N4-gp56 family major capsid protein